MASGQIRPKARICCGWPINSANAVVTMNSVGDSLKHRTDHMRFVMMESQAEEHSTCIGVPVGQLPRQAAAGRSVRRSRQSECRLGSIVVRFAQPAAVFRSPNANSSRTQRNMIPPLLMEPPIAQKSSFKA